MLSQFYVFFKREIERQIGREEEIDRLKERVSKVSKRIGFLKKQYFNFPQKSLAKSLSLADPAKQSNIRSKL